MIKKGREKKTHHYIMGRISAFKGIKTVASADIAELSVVLDKDINIVVNDCHTHVKNLQAKQVLTLSEFRAMFYARGDNEFCIACVYDSPLSTNSIRDSVWGKRIDVSPYQTQIINFNKIGGREDHPKDVYMAYADSCNLDKSFLAQFEIIKNIEKDLGVAKSKWSAASRMNIEDQLYALSFAPENMGDLSLQVVKGRKWQDVVDKLEKNCKASRGQKILVGELVSLYINIRILSNTPCVKPTLLRIKYVVKWQLEGQDHWNNRAANAANNSTYRPINQNVYIPPTTNQSYAAPTPKVVHPPAVYQVPYQPPPYQPPVYQPPPYYGHMVRGTPPRPYPYGYPHFRYR